MSEGPLPAGRANALQYLDLDLDAILPVSWADDETAYLMRKSLYWKDEKYHLTDAPIIWMGWRLEAAVL